MDISSIFKRYPKRIEFVLEILHEIQNHSKQNYLSDSSLKKVSHHFNIPLAQVYGIVSYYSILSTKPRGKFVIRVCKSPVCSMMGSKSVLELLHSAIKKDLSNQKDQFFTIEESECLGQCNESPCMMLNGKFYGNLTPEKIESIVSNLKSSV